VSDFATAGRKLGEILAELNQSRRDRRGDRCERIVEFDREHGDKTIGWLEDNYVEPPTPCFKEDYWTAPDEMVPIYIGAPEKMCAACQRNGARAQNEAALRQRRGVLLRSLCAMARSRVTA